MLSYAKEQWCYYCQEHRDENDTVKIIRDTPCVFHWKEQVVRTNTLFHDAHDHNIFSFSIITGIALSITISSNTSIALV
jgi:hypothetical protein